MRTYFSDYDRAKGRASAARAAAVVCFHAIILTMLLLTPSGTRRLPQAANRPALSVFAVPAAAPQPDKASTPVEVPTAETPETAVVEQAVPAQRGIVQEASSDVKPNAEATLPTGDASDRPDPFAGVPSRTPLSALGTTDVRRAEPNEALLREARTALAGVIAGRLPDRLDLLVEIDASGVVVAVRDFAGTLSAEQLGRVQPLLVGRRLFDLSGSGSTEWRLVRMGAG